MSEPRKRHLVAQTYQRGFARHKGKAFQVRVLNKWSGEASIRDVRDAFSQRDWNTVTTEDGLSEFGIERVLAEHVDAEAAPLSLEYVSTGFLWTVVTARRWRSSCRPSCHVAAQRARAWPSRSLRSTGCCSVDYSDERLREITGELPTPELREMMASSEQYLDIRPTNAMLLQAMLSSVREIAEIVYKRTWTLVRFDQPRLFAALSPKLHPDNLSHPLPSPLRIT